MNNLKEFVKMSAKAVEIQKLHKPISGDLYCCSCDSCTKNLKKPYVIQDHDIDCLNNRDLTNVEPNYASMVRSSSVGGFVAYYHTRCDESLSYIWLPRQGQLQEMVSKHKRQGYIEQRFHKFCKSSPEHDRNRIYYLNLGWSMEQLWLAFVMHEQWNKRWTGEDWENINGNRSSTFKSL